MVPSTPGGELYKILKEVAEKEAAEGGVKFKIVEKGGRSIKGMVQKSNPTATEGCSSENCKVCQGGRGKGGNCRKTNIQYEMECLVCPDDSPTTYVGETARNLFTRANELVKGEGGRVETAGKRISSMRWNAWYVQMTAQQHMLERLQETYSPEQMNTMTSIEENKRGDRGDRRNHLFTNTSWTNTMGGRPFSMPR